MMNHLTNSDAVADTTRSNDDDNDDDDGNKNAWKNDRKYPNQQHHQPSPLPSSSSSPQQKQEQELVYHPNNLSPTSNNRIQQVEYQYHYQQQLLLLLQHKQQQQQQQYNQQIIQQQQSLRHPYPPLSLSPPLPPPLYSSTLLDKNTSGGTKNPIVGVAIGATTHSTNNRIGPPLPTSPGLSSPSTLFPLPPPTYSSSYSSYPTIVTPPLYNNSNSNNNLDSVVGSASQQQQPQQSPPPSSPCWIHTVSSMIQHAHAQRNSNNNHTAFLLLQSLQVVAVNMTRKSMTQPWGLGFVSTMQNTSTTTDDTNSSGAGVAGACDPHHYHHRRVIITSSPSSSSSSSSSSSNKNKNMTTTGNNTVVTVSNNNNNNKGAGARSGTGAGEEATNNDTSSNVTVNNVSYSWTRTIVPYQYPVHRNDIIIDRDDTTTIHTNGGALNKGTTYSEQLKRAMSITTTTTDDDNNSNDNDDGRNDGIRPGDILVAIDGRSIFDFDFTMNSNNNNNNMTQMTSYLKASQSVCLVVLRHPEVVAVNASVNAQRIEYDPIRISSRANTIWNQLLILPTMTASSLLLSFSSSLSLSVEVPPNVLLPPIPTESITTFQQWIGVRKRAWRRRYRNKVYKYKFDISNKIVKKKKREKVKKQKRQSGSEQNNSNCNCNSNIDAYDHVHNNDDCDCASYHSKSFGYPENSDFWIQQGFGSFQEWMSSRTKTWKRSYQWNQQKRQQIEQDCCGEKVVSLPWTIHTTTTHAHSNKMKTVSTTTLHHHQTQNTKKRAPTSSFSITRPSTKRKRDHHHHSSSGNTVGQGHGQDDDNDNNNDKGGCSTEVFQQWLKIRRYQWRMLRRGRKRQQQQHVDANTNTDDDSTPITTPTKSDTTTTEDTVAVAIVSDHTKLSPSSSLNESLCRSDSITSSSEQEGAGGGKSNFPPTCKRKLQLLLSRKEDQEMAFMDEILDEQEKEQEEEQRRRSERPPLDITRFLDASCGIPDDVIVHCFSYLHAEQEHGKMFAVSKHITQALQQRHMVWKQLCPTHWILPRRPRQPWHTLYLTRLRQEQERQQKRWDDLLLKCSTLLFKRDDLQKLEKLVIKAEQDFDFDVNYSSGVVCERNSLLNLAVIHKRHKIVRWLVDRPPPTTTTTQCRSSRKKESPPDKQRRRRRRCRRTADIETYDRGNFTPLLNAAWNGDRFLVRFFLQRQANRNVRGTQHYTKGIAPPGFQGRTAAQWADQRGFPEVAKLIRLGL